MIMLCAETARPSEQPAAASAYHPDRHPHPHGLPLRAERAALPTMTT